MFQRGFAVHALPAGAKYTSYLFVRGYDEAIILQNNGHKREWCVDKTI